MKGMDARLDADGRRSCPTIANRCVAQIATPAGRPGKRGNDLEEVEPEYCLATLPFHTPSSPHMRAREHPYPGSRGSICPPASGHIRASGREKLPVRRSVAGSATKIAAVNIRPLFRYHFTPPQHFLTYLCHVSNRFGIESIFPVAQPHKYIIITCAIPDRKELFRNITFCLTLK